MYISSVASHYIIFNYEAISQMIYNVIINYSDHKKIFGVDFFICCFPLFSLFQLNFFSNKHIFFFPQPPNFSFAIWRKSSRIIHMCCFLRIMYLYFIIQQKKLVPSNNKKKQLSRIYITYDTYQFYTTCGYIFIDTYDKNLLHVPICCH